MKQTSYIERKLLCRDGPRLEMSNSTRTDHCGSRTAMVTSLNSIVRSSANVSAETVVLATDVKPAGFNGNVRNDCSTVTTNLPMGRSQLHMLCRNPFRRKPLLHQGNPWGRHGRSAMTGTLIIAAFEFETIRLSRLSRGWVSPNGSWKLNGGNQIFRRGY